MIARPFVIAHRAGNDLDALGRAAELGLPWVEADLRLFRGRIEVRHLKTLGPVRVLWDRWFLAPRSTGRLLLGELLAAAPRGTGTQLVLDLKGPDARLGRRVVDALRAEPDLRPITVCARSWRQLRHFRDEPGVRLLHSVGSAGQLRRVLRGGDRLEGVSIHARLLTRETAARLRERADLLVSWPVNTLEEARRLLALGVDGLITDEPERLAAALGR